MQTVLFRPFGSHQCSEVMLGKNKAHHIHIYTYKSHFKEDSLNINTYMMFVGYNVLIF